MPLVRAKLKPQRVHYLNMSPVRRTAASFTINFVCQHSYLAIHIPLFTSTNIECLLRTCADGDHACHPPKGVVSTRRRTHTSKHPTASPPPRIIDHYSSTMMGPRELRRWYIGLDLLSRNSKGDGLGATGCRLSARLEPSDTQRTLEFLFDFLQPCSSRMYYIQPSYVTNH